jgi:hypothetical protein
MSNARSTDPNTSRNARKSDTLEARILGVLLSHGPKTCWELVLQLNADRLSASHDPDNPPREVTIDSVSTCMRPMCRRGEVHEQGTKENTVRDTGNQVIVWAFGPDQNPQPHNPMPKVETGPRNKKLVPDISFTVFLPDELRTKLAEFNKVEQLVEWLNLEMVKRVELSFE